jgi:hypothetical protein
MMPGYRECFTPGRVAPGNAANIRLCKEHWAEAHHTRAQRPCERTKHSTDVRQQQGEMAIHPRA